MAGSTSGDHLENGAVEGQKQGIAGASDQARADREQSLADADQSASESDQTAADRDQTAAEADQEAADQDQEASDRNLAQGGDLALHKLTRDLRSGSAHQREESARQRFEAATARDAAAEARDRAARARDQAAELRDRELATRADAWAHDKGSVTGAEVVIRAAGDRRRAAADRAAAAEARAGAAADRRQAARDREQAARDRVRAQADRELLMHQLKVAETDSLTGARTRRAGLDDLDLEIDRARRTNGLLVMAYVDVVGLKAVNDRHGHAAGDAVLRRVVGAFRAHLRSYDLIVRVGGDEFLCALSGTTLEDARRRFDAVRAALAAGADPSAVRVGLAGLMPGDSAADLIERADAALPASPGR